MINQKVLFPNTDISVQSTEAAMSILKIRLDYYLWSAPNHKLSYTEKKSYGYMTTEAEQTV